MTRLRARLARNGRSEAGFTVTEVIIVVVIMGLVMGPLCMALTQALNLMPQSSARVRSATENERALLAWSSDAMQTQTYVNAAGSQSYGHTAGDPTTTSTTPLLCPGTAPNAGSPVGAALIWSAWSDQAAGTAATGAYWRLLYTRVTGSTTRVLVELQRTPNFVNYSTYVTGYCNIAQPVATLTTTPPRKQSAGATTDGDITLTLTLLGKDGVANSPVTFAGKMRVTNY